MDLKHRIAMAQLLSELLQQDSIVKFGNKKVEDELKTEVEGFLKRNLQSLLNKVMGEQTSEEFSAEEVAILKAFTQKIKGNQPGANT